MLIFFLVSADRGPRRLAELLIFFIVSPEYLRLPIFFLVSAEALCLLPSSPPSLQPAFSLANMPD